MFIEYKNVNIYQGDKLVLGGVDFHVDEGEFVYIIGHVGSGKSSLLKTLYCELDIDEGDEAVILERNLLKMKRKEVPALRKELGIIFQDFQLLHDRSVYNNLRFVLKATGWKNKKDMDERIDEVLEAVGMQDKKASMPYELSGGEQQRVAIARALVNSPAVLLADEPSGNLDSHNRDEIHRLFFELRDRLGQTVVIVTHDEHLAAMADRKITMSDGRIL